MCVIAALCLLVSQECLSWTQMAEHLNSYGQVQTTRGLTDQSHRLMAIFVNPVQDTWSIVRQNPQGCAIVWAQGIGWKWLHDRSAVE